MTGPMMSNTFTILSTPFRNMGKLYHNRAAKTTAAPRVTAGGEICYNKTEYRI